MPRYHGTFMARCKATVREQLSVLGGAVASRILLAVRVPQSHQALAVIVNRIVSHIRVSRPEIRMSAEEWEYANYTFSQLGEDVVINHILYGKHLFAFEAGGFYVDVGAYHPFTYSNTALLHMNGWRGVNIDASQDSIDTFNRMRPRDKNILCAISGEERMVFFPKNMNPENRMSATEVDGGIRMVTRKLSGVLEELNVSTVDFLSIDCEGEDEDILRSFDLDRYRVKVLCVEILDPLAREKIEQMLDERGYVLYSVHIISYIFIRKEGKI